MSIIHHKWGLCWLSKSYSAHASEFLIVIMGKLHSKWLSLRLFAGKEGSLWGRERERERERERYALCVWLKVSVGCRVWAVGPGEVGMCLFYPLTWFINSALLILNNPETFTPHLTCCFWPCVRQNICGVEIAVSQRRRGQDTDYERDFGIKSLEGEMCGLRRKDFFCCQKP